MRQEGGEVGRESPYSQGRMLKSEGEGDRGGVKGREICQAKDIEVAGVRIREVQREAVPSWMRPCKCGRREVGEHGGVARCWGLLGELASQRVLNPGDGG